MKKSSHVSLPRPCFWCLGVGWWKAVGKKHIMCPACKGGGAIRKPIRREIWESQIDLLVRDIGAVI